MAWSFFGRKRRPAADTRLPAESFVVLAAETEGSPDVWIVNQALVAFAGKAAFPWHLSILIGMQDVHEVGLPTPEEQQVLGQLGESLQQNLAAVGNALLMASITWSGTRQLVFRVRDPEVANAYLSQVVSAPSPVRPMEYRMEQDAGWELAETYLAPAR